MRVRGRGRKCRQGRVYNLLLVLTPPPCPAPATSSPQSQARTGDHGGETGSGAPAPQVTLLPWPSIPVGHACGWGQQPLRGGEEMPRADRIDLKCLFTTVSLATPCPANRSE